MIAYFGKGGSVDLSAPVILVPPFSLIHVSSLTPCKSY